MPQMLRCQHNFACLHSETFQLNWLQGALTQTRMHAPTFHELNKSSIFCKPHQFQSQADRYNPSVLACPSNV